MRKKETPGSMNTSLLRENPRLIEIKWSPTIKQLKQKLFLNKLFGVSTPFIQQLYVEPLLRAD